MDKNEFEDYITSGARDEYVDEEALQYVVTNFEFDSNVEEVSALNVDDEVNQDRIVSVSLPSSSDKYSDQELVEMVREAIDPSDTGRGPVGGDIQKYQLRHNHGAARKIKVYRHGNGYSAFALR